MLTTDEVAERLHIKRDTVSKWVRTGKLKAIKIGRRLLITEEEYERFVKSHS